MPYKIMYEQRITRKDYTNMHSTLYYRRWLWTSWDHLMGLIHSREAAKAGVHLVSGYHLFSKPVSVNIHVLFIMQLRYIMILFIYDTIIIL